MFSLFKVIEIKQLKDFFSNLWDYPLIIFNLFISETKINDTGLIELGL